jgi:hypothetical protein
MHPVSAPRGRLTAILDAFGTPTYSKNGLYSSTCSPYYCVAGVVLETDMIPSIAEVIQQASGKGAADIVRILTAEKMPFRLCAGVLNKHANQKQYSNPWAPLDVCYDVALQRVQMEATNAINSRARVVVVKNDVLIGRTEADISRMHGALVGGGTEMLRHVRPDFKFDRVDPVVEFVDLEDGAAQLARTLCQPIYEQISAHGSRGPQCFSQEPSLESYQGIFPFICEKGGDVLGHGIGYIPKAITTTFSPPVTDIAA